MTGCRIVARMLALLMIAPLCSSALAAEPVSYAIKFVASGDVDGVPFTDELQVFAGVTDTDTVAALAEASPAQLAQIIFALSYVVGLPFVIGSIFRFKQHKDNPQRFAVEVSPPNLLTVPVVRDGGLVTLTIDSIGDNTIEVMVGDGHKNCPPGSANGGGVFERLSLCPAKILD
jgi:hypothetical protein